VQDKRVNEQATLSEPGNYFDEKISFLAHTPIFQQLNNDEILALAHITTPTHCQGGHILYYPGQKNNTLFLLKSGGVQIYHLSADGRKLITQSITAGECFGAFPGSPLEIRTSFAEAICNSELFTLQKADLDDLLQVYPAINSGFLQLLGQQLLTLERQLTATTFHTATARLASLLLQLAQPTVPPLKTSRGHTTHSTLATHHEFVVQGFSHEDLADRLGVYRETVSTALRELKDVGAIKIARKHITISQPARLQDMAQASGKTHSNHSNHLTHVHTIQQRGDA
jgi:CRP-like cAMP-binding protein